MTLRDTTVRTGRALSPSESGKGTPGGLIVVVVHERLALQSVPTEPLSNQNRKIFSMSKALILFFKKEKTPQLQDRVFLMKKQKLLLSCGIKYSRGQKQPIPGEKRLYIHTEDTSAARSRISKQNSAVRSRILMKKQKDICEIDYYEYIKKIHTQLRDRGARRNS